MVFPVSTYVSGVYILGAVTYSAQYVTRRHPHLRSAGHRRTGRSEVGVPHHLADTPPSPVVGALRPLLPELAAALPPQPPALDDRLAERPRVLRALPELFGSTGPAVLALEDLHRADEQTIDFVNYLMADPPPELPLVLTSRGEDADPRVRTLAAKLPPPMNRVSLSLRPLTAAETAGPARRPQRYRRPGAGARPEPATGPARPGPAAYPWTCRFGVARTGSAAAGRLRY